MHSFYVWFHQPNINNYYCFVRSCDCNFFLITWYIVPDIWAWGIPGVGRKYFVLPGSAESAVQLLNLLSPTGVFGTTILAQGRYFHRLGSSGTDKDTRVNTRYHHWLTVPNHDSIFDKDLQVLWALWIWESLLCHPSIEINRSNWIMVKIHIQYLIPVPSLCHRAGGWSIVSVILSISGGLFDVRSLDSLPSRVDTFRQIAGRGPTIQMLVQLKFRDSLYLEF
jgi:hypothetical protein